MPKSFLKPFGFTRVKLASVSLVILVISLSFSYYSHAAGLTGDINSDGVVDTFDLSFLLSSYNSSGSACITNSSFTCDLNGDNFINIFDLSTLLSHWGQTSGGSGAPVNTAEPVVSGTVATGSTLTTTNGSWSGSPTSFTYQWQDCAKDGTVCSDISGATANTYAVTAGDSGHTIEAVVTAHNASGSTPSNAPIVPLVDNFSGTSVDTNIWRILNEQGDTSNNENVCYIPAQVAEGSNMLTETAIVNNRAAPPTSGHCPSGTPNSTSTGWDSGAVQEGSTAFTYGTVVVSAKLAGPGTAMWPVVWLLGAACQGSAGQTWLSSPGGFNCPWDSDASDAAEIDIAEGFEKSTTQINEQIHSSGSGAHCIPALSDYSQNFHTYELDWAPGSMTWKIDGVSKCSTTTNVPSHPMFLIINSGVCSGVSLCGGSPVNGNFPNTTTVDYVYVSH
jgi:beta-glucanase (GH16 family)